MAIYENDSNRKRRAHKKSRSGCNSCRIRKCDETLPKCKKCVTYNAVCSYDIKAKLTGLQSSIDGTININILQISNIKATIGTIAHSPSPVKPFQEYDLELVHRFRTRTIPTITTDHNRAFYENDAIGLIPSHPYLMHAILTVTLMQDRQTSQPENTHLSTPEAFHWGQAITSFNNKISNPIKPTERDALWVTASLLGIATFSHIEASTPSEAWPLKPPSPLDLNWLRMADGKKLLWKLSQPNTPDRISQTLGTDPIPSILGLSMDYSFDNLPSELIILYNLSAFSTPESNPYHSAAVLIARCITSDDAFITAVSFISFISSMDPTFRTLLEQKDPRAMLLLAYFYGAMCPHRLLWMWRRARLEGLAICAFLERYCWYDVRIMKAVKWPRIMCAG